MIRVFIVDDHAIVRTGIRRMIEDEDILVFAGESVSFAQTQSSKLDHTDVMILDLNLPDANGNSVLAWVKQHHPAIKVVVFTMNEEDAYATSVVRAGADAFVSKNREPEHLFQAIKKVADGGQYFSDQMMSHMANAPAGTNPPHKNLSDRETQIFILLAKGMGNKEIAEQLSLSPYTIGAHIHRIRQKMQVQNTAELIRYAYKHKLVK